MYRLIMLCLAFMLPCATAQAQSLPEQINLTLDAWTQLQKPNGSFPDYVHGGVAGRVGGYDEEVLGYALLLNGLRTGNQTQIDSGLHAFTWAFDAGPGLQAPDGRFRTSSFANVAAAAAYRLARSRMSDDPRFVALRARWEEHLRKITPAHLDGDAFGNKHMVDSVGVLELVRTGLHSDRPGTVLNQRNFWYRAAKRHINSRTPLIARSYRSRMGRHDAVVLSDPPRNPIAYHALTFGYMARGIQLLDGESSRAARRTLVAMSNGSLGITAPDGDVAYMGRSQEQAWALGLTAYGAQVAARQRGAQVSALRALTSRTLSRIERQHAGGPTQIAITPNLASFPGQDQLGLDSYASSAAYTGLSMMSALWALEQEPAAAARHGHIRADRDSHARLSPGVGQFATVRYGDSWYAVRTDPAVGAKGDWRMDFGLHAFKTRGTSGRWTDTLPLRPVSEGVRSAGPLLIRGGREALPYGRTLRVRRGVTRVQGGWKAAGRRVRSAQFTFAARGRSVAVSMPARAGDTIRYTLFLPRASALAVHANGFASERINLAVNAAVQVDAAGSYASGAEHDLARVEITVPVRGTQLLRFTLSAP